MAHYKRHLLWTKPLNQVVAYLVTMKYRKGQQNNQHYLQTYSKQGTLPLTLKKQNQMDGGYTVSPNGNRTAKTARNYQL